MQALLAFNDKKIRKTLRPQYRIAEENSVRKAGIT